MRTNLLFASILGISIVTAQIIILDRGARRAPASPPRVPQALPAAAAHRPIPQPKLAPGGRKTAFSPEPSAAPRNPLGYDQCVAAP